MRVCAPRLSLRISAERATASAVTSSERMLSASCQPGLYWLVPGAFIVLGALPSAPRCRVDALLELLLGADDADAVLHHVLELLVEQIRVFAASRGSRCRSRERIATLICSSSACGRARRACARTRPRRCPRAGRTRSDRRANCRRGGWRRACPPPHSPQANRPGHARHLRVGVHADAAHEVVERRARPPSAPW